MALAVAADRQILDASYTNVMRFGATLVEARDSAGYRKFCASLADAFTSATDRNTAVSLARAGLLLPDAETPLEECSRLTAFALQSDSGKASLPWSLAAHALSEYRCGRFEDAVTAAAQSLADPACHAACLPLASSVLAMAQFRAGRTAIAGTALQAAENELNKGWFDDTRKDLGGLWYDWLIGHILLREARGLIEGPPPTATQSR